MLPDGMTSEVHAFDAVVLVTYSLRPVDGGTEVTGSHEHLPHGVSVEDNELGWSISMGQLAELVEGRDR